MLKFLVEKEFKRIARNPFLPRMILIFPVMVLLVFPWAADFEIKNIRLCLLDNDHSTLSRRLVEKVVSGGYFRLTVVADGPAGALSSVEDNRSDIILEIPRGFEKNLIRGEEVKVLISADAVNGTKGGLSSAYLSGIISEFSPEASALVVPPGNASLVPAIEPMPLFRFNRNLNYQVFMVPALMVMVLTMITGFMPALSIVMEKETGTIEQINVTPAPRFLFILSKLLPFWIIGLVVITICFVIAWLVYGLVPAGSVSTIYLFAALYILAVSGMGLVISNYSSTMQQAMFVIFFFMLILIILSGLFTPISSMPRWAQSITYINPLKYLMQVMRAVYLKGSTLATLRAPFLAIVGFTLFFNTWAVLSYRKRI